MTLQSSLNKLLKRDLVKICADNNISLPSSVKTKKDLINFMIKYESWSPSLEEIIKKQGPASKPRKASSKISGISKTEFQELKEEVNSLKADISGLKSMVENLTKQITSNGSVSSQSSSELVDENGNPSPKLVRAIIQNIMDQESLVLEAFPEEEFVFLDDAFEFVGDLPKRDFKMHVRHLLMLGILEGKEGEGDIVIEIDGTNIAEVKKLER